MYRILIRPYFEAKARLNQSLDDQKRQIQLIEETIQMTKVGYADSLKQLEKISEEIHERRRKECTKAIIERKNDKQENTKNATLGTRQEGVGAEFPSPCPAERILKKQISEKETETYSEKCDMTRKRHTHQRKERNVSELNSREHRRKQPNSGSSDNTEPEANQSSKSIDAHDDIDSVPLMGGDISISNKYDSIKGKKLKKKKYHKLQSKSLPNNSPKASGKKAINQMNKKIQTVHDKNCNPRTESHPSASQDKRTSVSSSSTTESAGNDGISAPDSITSNASNNSRLSSRGSSSGSSSSDSCTSESPSQESSPKLCYERLKPSKQSTAETNLQSLTDASSHSILSTYSKHNLGLPIHPFENLGGQSGDQTNSKRDMCYDGVNLNCSPMKKKTFSPTALTNKYLSIKQEESEFSDAESLAR